MYVFFIIILYYFNSNKSIMKIYCGVIIKYYKKLIRRVIFV